MATVDAILDSINEAFDEEFDEHEMHYVMLMEEATRQSCEELI
jgi:hypothetical protein